MFSWALMILIELQPQFHELMFRKTFIWSQVACTVKTSLCKILWEIGSVFALFFLCLVSIPKFKISLVFYSVFYLLPSILVQTTNSVLYFSSQL